jgi:GTP-binding protein
MIIEAQFVKSAASARDLPSDGLPEVAMVGRSNVGKSSLINALVRGRVARAGSGPGTTRLANIYRVRRGGASPFYLVDLPGYGYARGDRADIDAAIGALFGQSRRVRSAEASRHRESARGGAARDVKEAEGARDSVETDGARGFSRATSALFLVDSRHPGLDNDLKAWRWLKATVRDTAVVATKIDKLARGERIRACRELESVFHDPVLPVSAATGEGLDELWKLIDRLANSRNNPHPDHSRRNRPSKATAPRPPAPPATPEKVSE